MVNVTLVLNYIGDQIDAIIVKVKEILQSPCSPIGRLVQVPGFQVLSAYTTSAHCRAREPAFTVSALVGFALAADGALSGPS
ncbi:hypothetical protein CO674_22930 [Rhizobium hidalgonense]|uniref:Uncharacterized protein n=1 Tax=Rhizobium hidalgonense TaxID=1538159 RepID=A0ABX4JNG6_9HYPH|nr:hypothetical protein CO674_22930 [Rhizobium hidalgonense]PON08098.1 hypothetical protein ATY29_08510 [Rhizobium hidalgonense]